MIDKNSILWRYLSDTQRGLVSDGELLIADRKDHPNQFISDYSYLVFPFAKLYEGFLKQLLHDLGFISDREYVSDHFRLGKVLSPNLIRRLGKHSAYSNIASRYSEELARRIWHTWKEGRNLVFHYFPHNVRRLSLSEAMGLIDMIVETMEESVARMEP